MEAKWCNTLADGGSMVFYFYQSTLQGGSLLAPMGGSSHPMYVRMHGIYLPFFLSFL